MGYFEAIGVASELVVQTTAEMGATEAAPRRLSGSF